MNTVTLINLGRLEVSDTRPPESIQQGQARVKVHRVGICGTDIHAYRGEQPFFSYPRILGHELGVEVIEVGEGVTHVRPGDRCAVEPYMNCGKCPPCRRGRTNCCRSLQCLGVHTDGGMREQIVLPAHKLHPSQTLSYEALALVETLGIGKHAVDRGQVVTGERIAVIGLGPIGLTVATFALLAGASVVGIDLSVERIESARSLLDIETLQLVPDTPINEQWHDTMGEAPTAVFDATGNRQSMRNAFDLPEHAGRLIFVGLVLGELSFNDPDFHRRELTLLASRNAVGDDFRQIIAWIESGRIDAERWITHRCKADDLPGLIECWLKPGANLLKGMVAF
ncbi:MAG: zinc-binding alcohol dehydrogenase family protein [Phycisphaeraceae bacterium]